LIHPLKTKLKFSLVFSKAASGGGNVTAWYDVETFENTDSDAFASDSSIEWSDVTIAAGGISDKARIYIAARFGPGDIKMGLYNSAGTTLLAEGTGSHTAGNQYLEINWNTPVALSSSTTYKLARIFSNGNIAMRFKSSSGAMTFGSNTYASGLPASLPGGSDISRGYAVGVHIQ
jgi:hypothetical protein